MHPIVNEIQNLPPQAQQEVINFVAALVKKQRHNPNHRLKQTWAGSMQSYRDTYTSLSLQKETVDDWANRVSD
ncbi:hypothetical protein C8255_26125 [filamentous cyanobacterium CCP3]|nr:hypothetical protein C8255_26125 [filamentous cyanobacterium CCP3]